MHCTERHFWQVLLNKMSPWLLHASRSPLSTSQIAEPHKRKPQGRICQLGLNVFESLVTTCIGNWKLLMAVHRKCWDIPLLYGPL